MFDRLPKSVRDVINDLCFSRFDLARIEDLVKSEGEAQAIKQIQDEDNKRAALYAIGKKKIAAVTPPNLWKIPRKA